MENKGISSMESFSDTISSSSNVHRLDTSNVRINLSEPSCSWWNELDLKLRELSNLENGWDGYNGVSMRFEVGVFAKEILKLFHQSILDVPDVVPGDCGDLQLEWHYGDNSIEVHIVSPYNVRVWRKVEETGEHGEEVKLTADFTILDQWFKDFYGQDSTDEVAASR